MARQFGFRAAGQVTRMAGALSVRSGFNLFSAAGRWARLPLLMSPKLWRCQPRPSVQASFWAKGGISARQTVLLSRRQ